MQTIIILIFIIGYLAITLEHPLKLDKTIPALFMATLIWALLAVGFQFGWFSVINSEGEVFSVLKPNLQVQNKGFQNLLTHHFAATAEILVFLIGAMTIVELIDLHQGFEVIKNFISTKSKSRLLWILGILAFFLSAIIDNLTTTIVLVTVTRKIIDQKELRIWYASLLIIAANAGGAWSPIGDVTTTMLWIANKISALGLIKHIVIPAIICFIVPFFIASRLKVFKGDFVQLEKIDNPDYKVLSSNKMLIFGLLAILFVPIFKTITHLPPYFGMLFSLAAVWLFSEFIHPEEDFDKTKNTKYSVNNALSRIEISSILFFLGILLSVSGLEILVFGTVNSQSVGTLRFVAEKLVQVIPNQDFLVVLLGVLSAIIDNVPLVAASMAMFTFPTDNPIWHFIAYSAGTGGSLLIIGSAAGVAAMGMEKISFGWYFKNISWLALLGFLAGAIVFILMQHV